MPDKLLGNFRHPWLTGIPVYSVPACPFLMDKKNTRYIVAENQIICKSNIKSFIASKEWPTKDVYNCRKKSQIISVALIAADGASAFGLGRRPPGHECPPSFVR